jgi:uncharacterized protein (TIGR03437 family)
VYESKSGTAKSLLKIANRAELVPARNGDKLLSLKAAAGAGALARLGFLWLAVATTLAWCQVPVVSSLVDAASYTPTLGVRGAVATIFGTNLSTTTASAGSLPLPTQLGGTRVEWNGVAVPLFYVSPTQINFQVPAPVGTWAAPVIVVSSVAGNSLPYRPEVETPGAWRVAGLFSADASGCGQGAVLNVAADGSMSLNSASNSAAPGDWISAFGTGIYLSAASFPPNGEPAPLTRIIGGSGGAGVFDFRRGSTPGFSGLAPGLVGVGQYNLQIPSTVREGCAVPVQMQFTPADLRTQPVTVAIRNGGGPCVDPPEASYGEILFQRTVATSASNTVTESETVTVSLQASPGKEPPPAPDPSLFVLPEGAAFKSLPWSASISGPSCPVAGYRSLDAGTVTVQGPALGPLPVPVAPYQEGQLGGLKAYQATLAKDALQGGTHTVTASGGRDVGPFQITAHIGVDIQLQTPLAGAHVWAGCEPLKIQWTGGDPDSWVTIKFVRRYVTGSEMVIFPYRTRTSSGGVTIPAETPLRGPCIHEVVGPLQLVIEVEPDPSAITPFSAPGLSLGGRVIWKYIHSFEVRLNVG